MGEKLPKMDETDLCCLINFGQKQNLPVEKLLQLTQRYKIEFITIERDITKSLFKNYNKNVLELIQKTTGAQKIELILKFKDSLENYIGEDKEWQLLNNVSSLASKLSSAKDWVMSRLSFETNRVVLKKLFKVYRKQRKLHDYQDYFEAALDLLNFDPIERKYLYEGMITEEKEIWENIFDFYKIISKYNQIKLQVKDNNSSRTDSSRTDSSNSSDCSDSEEDIPFFEVVWKANDKIKIECKTLLENSNVIKPRDMQRILNEINSSYKEDVELSHIREILNKIKYSDSKLHSFFQRNGFLILTILASLGIEEKSFKIFAEDYGRSLLDCVTNDNEFQCYKDTLQNIFKVVFRLYPERSAGVMKSGCAVFDVSGKTSNEKLSCGFIVTVPVPLLSSYGEGGDQNPLTIIEMYLESAKATYPKCDNLHDVLHVVVGLNLLDDYEDLFTNTEESIKKVCRAAVNFNQQIKDKDYPATVIPLLWGNEGIQKKDIYRLSDMPEQSVADEIRETLRAMKCRWNLVLPKPKFPFASMRSFLIDCNPCQVHLKNLKENCGKVYIITADADLLSVPKTYFRKLKKTVETNSEKMVYRLGGSFCFDSNDIRSHIMKIARTHNLLPEDVEKSVKLTAAVHELDIKTRRIMYEETLPYLNKFDAYLTYFSEANSAILCDVFDLCKYNSSNKLTEKMRNSMWNVPDYGDFFTKTTRQKKNWDPDVKDNLRTEIFLSDGEASVVLSSRHDLCIVKNERVFSVGKITKKSENVKSCDFMYHSLQGLRYILESLHNHQTRLPQINMRISNGMVAGDKAKNALHKIIDDEKERFPYVYCFLNPKKDETEEERENTFENLSSEVNDSLLRKVSLNDSTLPEDFVSKLAADVSKKLKISNYAQRNTEVEMTEMFLKIIERLNIALEYFLRQVLAIASVDDWGLESMMKEDKEQIKDFTDCLFPVHSSTPRKAR